MNEDEKLKYLLIPNPLIDEAASEVGRGLVEWEEYKDHQLMKLSRIFREEGFDDAAERIDRVFAQRHYKMAEHIRRS